MGGCCCNFKVGPDIENPVMKKFQKIVRRTIHCIIAGILIAIVFITVGAVLLAFYGNDINSTVNSTTKIVAILGAVLLGIGLLSLVITILVITVICLATREVDRRHMESGLRVDMNKVPDGAYPKQKA